MNAADAAVRVAISEASEAFCARLRRRYGLAPGVLPLPVGLGYCGREYRVYPSMRIVDAMRFYAALHVRWNDARLRDALARAGLDERFEIRRMKRAYQRALVLAFALAAEPALLVVENAEEFDETGSRALLQYAVDLVPSVIVTYGVNVTHPLVGLAAPIDASAYEADG